MHALPPKNNGHRASQAIQRGKGRIDSAARDCLQNRFLFRKIESPTYPSAILHRVRLIAMLKAAIAGEDEKHAAVSPSRFVLLCAPAGYGKTTLLADFASSTRFPCCWYFLDSGDNDCVVFLRTLLLSLRQAFPHFGSALETILTSVFTGDVSFSTEAYHAAADAFCAAIAAEIPERFALFLCNYEEISENETLTSLINYLLKKLPPQVSLVVESRAIPHIEFAHLLVCGKMVGLNSDALRFSAQEIADLATLRGLAALTPAEAEQLAASFDGWIAGILLGTHLGDFHALPVGQIPSDRQGASFLKANAAAAQTRNHLFTYVANEIFQ